MIAFSENSTEIVLTLRPFDITDDLYIFHPSSFPYLAVLPASLPSMSVYKNFQFFFFSLIDLRKKPFCQCESDCMLHFYIVSNPHLNSIILNSAIVENGR